MFISRPYYIKDTFVQVMLLITTISVRAFTIYLNLNIPEVTDSTEVEKFKFQIVPAMKQRGYHYPPKKCIT